MNKWKDIPYSGVRKLNIVKILSATQRDLQIQRNPYEDSRNNFFCRIENPILNFTWNQRDCAEPKRSKKRRTNFEDSDFLISKLTIKLW